MATQPKRDLFTPAPNRMEAQRNNTRRLAQQIIDSETALRKAKTERLRKARLEMEASREAEPEPVKPAKRRKKGA